MTPLVNPQGKVYTLGADLDRGGEAVVYRLQNRPTQLAKIYLHPTPEYELKLKAMLANPPDDPSLAQNHTSIAWPVDIIYTPDKQFCGYIMPYIVDAIKLVEVFNPRRRRQKLPGFGEPYQHRAAYNLAAAVAALHYREYVVGDLNESNVLVKSNTLITIIDTDSFQVRGLNRLGHATTYPCPVGKPEYVAPEFQGKNFKRTRRTPESDNFALGVLIFQLLMEGSHPFRSQWLKSDEPPTTAVKISEGWFPYSGMQGSPVGPPTNGLPFESLHPVLQDLVLACFVDGHKQPEKRPTADEWIKAIARAEASLRPCGNGHHYSAHLSQCPRCLLSEQRQSRQPDSPRPARNPVIPMQQPLPPSKPGPFPPAAGNPSSGIVRPNPNLPHPAIPRWQPAVNNPPAPSTRPTQPQVRQRWQRPTSILGAVLMGGIGLGSLLGNWLGGETSGTIVGGLAGFFAGAGLGDMIALTVGWPFILAGLIGLTLGFVSYMGQMHWFVIASSVFAGLVSGWLLGKFGGKNGWTITIAILGGAAGIWGAQTLANAIQNNILSGGVNGGLAAALLGITYYVWNKLKALNPPPP